MITNTRFHEIKDEVQAAVKELFDYAAENYEDNYLLWLADADYSESLEKAGYNPHVLSSMVDYYKEFARFKFSEFYLNNLYSFPADVTQSEDQPFWLQLEMMIYSHVWESNKFLKQLYRLQEIVHGHRYHWRVDIPESSKHTFIRTTIREGFRNKGLKIAEVMRKGFHTSLRNSFLHSEYEIEKDKGIIRLHTHRIGRKQPFEIDEISFIDWTERFVYTVFLNYFFINEKFQRRKTVNVDFGKDEFSLVLPVSRTGSKMMKLYYDESRGDFSTTKSVPYVPAVKAPAMITDEDVDAKASTPLVTKEELDGIEKQMIDSVNELLDLLQATDIDKYITWLFDIRYNDATGKYASFVSEDATRLNFSATLFHEVYLGNVQLPTMVRLQMELLVYSHIWESKPLLHQLRGAARILAAIPVNPEEDLDADRRELINDIMAKLTSQNCSLSTLINQSFHTSLRNAFAHSEYDIDLSNQLIHLDTYKEERSDWDIKNITFAEWKSRFLRSVAIDYQILIARATARESITPQQLQDLLDRLNSSIASTAATV